MIARAHRHVGPLVRAYVPPAHRTNTVARAQDWGVGPVYVPRGQLASAVPCPRPSKKKLVQHARMGAARGTYSMWSGRDTSTSTPPCTCRCSSLTPPRRRLLASGRREHAHVQHGD